MARDVRVLVANRPRLIRDLIPETISDQPDIEVVGEVRYPGAFDISSLSTPLDALLAASEPVRLAGPCDNPRKWKSFISTCLICQES